MINAKFVLIDALRAEAFALLADVTKRFDDWSQWTDGQGIHWAGRRIGRLGIAIPSLGQSWVFDRFAREHRVNEHAELQGSLVGLDDSGHGQRLRVALRGIRLGKLSTRLLMTVHAHVLRARTSVVKIPDFVLARAMWGADQESRPRHWRKDIASIGDSLGWLHLIDPEDTDAPDFGAATALLTHFADLRGMDEDVCDSSCSGAGGPPHHHFISNIGPGFLGVLERFAGTDDGSGVRIYDFPVGGSRGGPTLRRVGKSGRLVSLFLPAEIGDPSICNSFTSSQLRLFRALNRETTRAKKQRRKGPSDTETIDGNQIPDIRGRKLIQCDLLDANSAYAGFNGNKKRHGLGYYLSTSGGLLAKAGYDLGDVQAYLADLTRLAERLDLVAVGIHVSTAKMYSLDEMTALSLTAVGQRELDKLHVRVYAPADFADRWSKFFLGPEPSTVPVNRPLAPAVAISRELARKRINRRGLALGIGADLSLLSKIFNGKKAWPAAMLKRATDWLESQPAPPLAPIMPAISAGGTDMLNVAIAYMQRGWSVVPQITGAKSPWVKWKPFQSRLPTVVELQRWFRAWPLSGLAVVLGPISDLFVIDVDGADAHAALVERLGSEPLAPKAMSGSGNPFRYHLFFRHPSVATKAKFTPWYPKLEFRGNRGIVVIAPSLHKSGNRYLWAPGQSLDDLPLPEVPTPVLATLAESVSRPTAVPPGTAAANVPLPLPAISACPATREFLTGIHADGPNWNGRLFAAACDLKGRGVPIETAQPLLLSGAGPWNDREAEIAVRTIQSAYSQPRSPAYR